MTLEQKLYYCTMGTRRAHATFVAIEK